MPYKRYEPATDEEMNLKRWEGHYSICQFIRDVFHMTDDPEIKTKCRHMIQMAKAMQKKLEAYKNAEGSR